jgi:hypothetical protein
VPPPMAGRTARHRKRATGSRRLCSGRSRWEQATGGVDTIPKAGGCSLRPARAPPPARTKGIYAHRSASRHPGDRRIRSPSNYAFAAPAGAKVSGRTARSHSAATTRPRRRRQLHHESWRKQRAGAFPSFASNTRHADRQTAPRSRSLRSGHHLSGVILMQVPGDKWANWSNKDRKGHSRTSVRTSI